MRKPKKDNNQQKLICVRLEQSNMRVKKEKKEEIILLN